MPSTFFEVWLQYDLCLYRYRFYRLVHFLPRTQKTWCTKSSRSGGTARERENEIRILCGMERTEMPRRGAYIVDLRRPAAGTHEDKYFDFPWRMPTKVLGDNNRVGIVVIVKISLL